MSILEHLFAKVKKSANRQFPTVFISFLSNFDSINVISTFSRGGSKHPTGSSIKSAICEDFSKFCLDVRKAVFLASSSMEFPQISTKTSELYLLFGQYSSGGRLVGFNFKWILKHNCGNNHRYLSIYRTMYFF